MKIRIKVVPNSKHEEVTGEGDYFVVRVKEPPKEGKANKAVIKVLAHHFKVPQSSVSISPAVLGAKIRLSRFLRRIRRQD